MAKSFFLLILLAFAACTPVPRAEFALYSAAFDTAHGETTKLLDVYNKTEIALLRVTHKDEIASTQFFPDMAFLIVDGTQGPETMEMREGFALVKLYNDILSRYISGTSIALYKPQIDALKKNLDSTGVSLADTSVTSPLKGVLSVAESVLKLGLLQADQKEFAVSLDNGSKKVEAFLKHARDEYSTNMYAKFVSDLTNRRAAKKLTSAELRVEKVKYKKMLAAWVLMLDETRKLLKELTEASKNKASSTGLAGLVATSENLAIYAGDVATIRRSLETSF